MVHWAWLIVAFIASPLLFLLWLALLSDEPRFLPLDERAADEAGADRP